MNHSPAFWIECTDEGADHAHSLRRELLSKQTPQGGVPWLVSLSNRAASLGFRYLVWDMIAGQPKVNTLTPSVIGPSVLSEQLKHSLEQAVPALRKAPYLTVGAYIDDRLNSTELSSRALPADPYCNGESWRTTSRVYLANSLSWWFGLGIPGIIWNNVASSLQRERLARWTQEFGKSVAFQYVPPPLELYRHPFVLSWDTYLQLDSMDSGRYRNTDPAAACIHLRLSNANLHEYDPAVLIEKIRTAQASGYTVDACDGMSDSLLETILCE